MKTIQAEHALIYLSLPLVEQFDVWVFGVMFNVHESFEVRRGPQTVDHTITSLLNSSCKFSIQILNWVSQRKHPHTSTLHRTFDRSFLLFLCFSTFNSFISLSLSLCPAFSGFFVVFISDLLRYICSFRSWLEQFSITHCYFHWFIGCSRCVSN